MQRSSLTHERVFRGDFAEEYARRHENVATKFGQEVATKLSARGFEGGRIIDVGCGFGTTAIVLARAFPDSEVIGIDLSDPLLQLADQAAQATGLVDRVRFEEADVQSMPYEDNSFDVAVNVQMLHIVEDPIAMLNEMERVLTPAGFLFVADIRRSWVGLLDKVFRSALTVEEARALVSQSRLREGTFSAGLLWWRFEA